MNHYQKLAVLLIRSVGVTVAALGVLGAAYGLAVLKYTTHVQREQMERFYGSFWYALYRFMLLALGRPLGRFLGRGLE